MKPLIKQARTYFAAHKYGESEKICRRILSKDPDNWPALQLRGVIAMKSGSPVRAAQYLRLALALKPDNYQTLVSLGLALLAAKKKEEAVTAFEQAVRLEPSRPDAYQFLGTHFLTEKDHARADEALTRAVALKPESAECLELLATTCFRAGNHDRAFDLAQKAVALAPDRAGCRRLLADILTRRGDYDLARGHYEAALQLQPDSSDALSNYGLFNSRTGNHEAALAAYSRAFALNPDDVPTRYGLSHAWLVLGQLKEGWPLYEARLKMPGRRTRYPDRPPLNRLPGPGERVILWTDQGIGDQVLFASLLPDLLKTGAELAVECDYRMITLLKRSFPRLALIPAQDTDSDAISRADGHISLADTAQWLRPDLASFPRHNGYLVADRTLSENLAKAYRKGRDHMPVVGISWQTRKTAKVSDQKSIPLAQWAPILRVPGVTFVSLQYGECAEELAAVAAATGVKLIRDPTIDAMRSLDECAAQVAAMDLVITTSSTTAHVAGALNVPCWTMVPHGYGGLWHWFLDREDSPWYPSVRLFRQKIRREWPPVIDTVSEQLATFVESWRAQNQT